MTGNISRIASLLIVACSLSNAVRAADQPRPEDLEFFEKRVRPLLVEHCTACHGPQKQKGGLRLDSREAAFKGGDSGAVIEPGMPDDSLLIEAVGYAGDYKMPPKGKLPAEQIAILTDWVKRGAPWPVEKTDPPAIKKENFDLAARRERQWAFQPLNTAPPPVLPDAPDATPIDRFIRTRLAAEGLSAAQPADKRTLLRRVTYDLIGLPPTAQEIDAFLSDPSPRAFETVVDRLLSSPHYGERWARHWLDLVRFAETAGHEFDFDLPQAFEYRDYVIRALNADLPYDQFVIEQIAGDLLPQPRRHPVEGFNESIIGTGFFFLGEAKHSPVDIRGDEAERVDNQIDVFSKTFLAQTLACARCHDHKFDAISTRDYYAIAGFLQSSRYQVACVDAPEPRAAIVRQLADLQDRRARLLKQSAAEAEAKILADLPRYLLGALAVLRPAADEARAPQPEIPADERDVVFEDFEKPGYAGWTASGTAFGDVPNRRPLPEYQGEVAAIGKGFVNTHSSLNRAGKRTVGDKLTGTLTSKLFTIDRPYMHFLIGGGAHAGKTCLNLRVADKVVRSATGRNANNMAWATFDVREFAGKEAQLEIVDQETGGWGNIGVDQITFSRQPVAGAASDRVIAVAQRLTLRPAELQKWTRYLEEIASKADSDPFHTWAALALQSGKVGPETVPRLVADLRARSQAQAETTAARREQCIVFEDFSHADYAGWFVTGDAFGTAPLEAPHVVPGPADGRVLSAFPLHAAPPASGAEAERRLSAAVAHSGVLAPQLQGVLRSRTFTIEKNQILYHMAGTGTQVNLIIDGFQWIRNPIYGGLTIALNQPDQMQWHVQNVSKWVGHKAYIEVIDAGSGTIAIDKILFSDAEPPPPAPDSLLAEVLGDPAIESPEALALAYARLCRSVVHDWRTGARPSQGREPAAMLDWLIDRDLAGSLRSALQSDAGHSVKMADLQRQQEELQRSIRYARRVMALADGTPEDEQVHLRGNHKILGDTVPRRLLEAIAGNDQPPVQHGSGRWELARRMVDPANPLLARVVVNRVWQHHFGEGIVRTPDDFGNMGLPPTHPELLDYLALEFMRNGWSLKQLHKQILLSETYRMSSHPGDAHAEQADPQNKLLHRMPIRRLEAEVIRDAMLAVSGRLNEKLYGPAVLPYLTPFMAGRGRPASGPLDGDGRRSIYISVRRNFLTPLFLAFDYPIPFSTMGRRSVSNVPAQALALMNNPFVVQQAETWASRTLAGPGDTRTRIGAMYVAAFARPPDDLELEAASRFLVEQEREYSKPDPLRAWTDLAHVLLNVKEFIFVN